MPGVNYMGGRRNTVKARAKDTISRQQKSHFGRQRRDILARGVSALKPSELAHAIPSSASVMYRPSAQDIELAHAHAQARTKLPVRPLESSGNEVVARYIPKPVHVLPSLCSPRSRASMRAPSGPEEGKKRRSTLLDELDMSDTVFMRGIMDEILAMPDLAGLGKSNQQTKRKKSVQPVTVNRNSSIRSRSASPNNNSPSLQSQNWSAFPRYASNHSSGKRYTRRRAQTPSSFQNSVYDISSSDYGGIVGDHPRASSIQSPSHSPQRREGRPNSPKADSKYEKTPARYAYASSSNKGRGSSYRSDFSSRQRSFHDSGSSGCDAWSVPGPGAVSPSWSTRFDDSQSSSRSNVQFSEVQDNWVVDTKMGEWGDYYADSGFHSDEFAARSPVHEIPKVIDFGQQRRRSGRQLSVYGALFEQEDPWRTIGVILGLEEDGIRSDANIPPPNTNIRESVDVDVDVPLDVDHGQFFEEDFDDPADGAEGDDAWEEDDGELEMDWHYQVSTWSTAECAVSDPRQESPHEMSPNPLSPTPEVGVLHEAPIDLRVEAPEAPILDIEDDNACDGMLVDIENELYADIDQPSMVDIDDDTCNVENELQDASEEQQGRILEVPALDEVDGKFLGPALFGDDFSSSEDE